MEPDTDGPDNTCAPRAPRKQVIVVDYDPTWPQAFAAAKAEILEAVGSDVECVEHVGSTAVAGLPAKPIIDIQVGVRDWNEAEAIVGPLGARGWVYRGEPPAIPGRRLFRKHDAANCWTYHLHVLRISSALWNEMLDFRDYLRAHPDAAAEYAALKRRLARRTYRERGEYRDAKAPFIQRILAQARG